MLFRCTTYSASAVSLRSSPVHSPLHSASVHVTQLSSSPNPMPVEKQELVINEVVRFGEDYLSPMRLVRIIYCVYYIYTDIICIYIYSVS